MLSRKYANVFVPACRLTEQLVAKAKSVAGTAAKTEFLYHGQKSALACPKVGDPTSFERLLPLGR